MSASAIPAEIAAIPPEPVTFCPSAVATPVFEASTARALVRVVAGLGIAAGALLFVLKAPGPFTLSTHLFALWLVFRCMGRDYEAAVICSGFGGIALGSTATAIANMSAIVRVYGAAPRAFIVVPLVCGFFIDLINALVIGLLAR